LQKVSIRKAEAELPTEGVTNPSLEELFLDDDSWATAAMDSYGRTVIFGQDESADLPNGFSDYRPGDRHGSRMALHLVTNMATRRVRIADEQNRATKATLSKSYYKFLCKADTALKEEMRDFKAKDAKVPKHNKSQDFMIIWRELRGARELLDDRIEKCRESKAKQEERRREEAQAVEKSTSL
jgi:hypothetical protein